MSLLRARCSFVVRGPDGARHAVREGDLVDSEDAVIDGRVELFDPAEASARVVFGPKRSRAEKVVEKATAAPGEKRTLRRKV